MKGQADILLVIFPMPGMKATEAGNLFRNLERKGWTRSISDPEGGRLGPNQSFLIKGVISPLG